MSFITTEVSGTGLYEPLLHNNACNFTIYEVCVLKTQFYIITLKNDMNIHTYILSTFNRKMATKISFDLKYFKWFQIVCLLISDYNIVSRNITYLNLNTKMYYKCTKKDLCHIFSWEIYILRFLLFILWHVV